MANGAIQSQIADSYLAQFNLNIGVSAMQKLQQFPFLQQLGYNGQLGYMKNDFHGLKDYYAQTAKYSTAHPILLRAWALIIGLALSNAKLSKLLFSAPGLGVVGNLFQSIHNFGQVFSLSPQDLADPTIIESKVNSASSSSASLVIANTTPTVRGLGGS